MKEIDNPGKATCLARTNGNKGNKGITAQGVLLSA
jgi:hypothetical protein